MWVNPNGYTKTFQVLIAAGADVNAKMWNGMTALMWAAYVANKGSALDRDGQEEVIRCLLLAGAHLNLKDNLGRSAYEFVSLSLEAEIAQLLKTGLPINKETIKAALALGKINIESANSKYVPFAVESGDWELLDGLIKRGCSLDSIRNGNGYWAFVHAAENGHADMLRRLLKEGVAVDSKMGKGGRTALMGASAKGHAEAVQALIEGGASPDTRAEDGYRALMCAAENGHTAIVKRLLQAGADPAVKNGRGLSAIDLASNSECVHLIRQALSQPFGEDLAPRPASVTAQGRFGETRVSPSSPGTAAIAGRFEVLREIGQGGMGKVFQAKDQKLGRVVAIKQLREEIRVNPREKERFASEARTVAKLRHPCIVEIYDIVDEGADVYLVFEFVDGSSLDAVLAQRKRIPLKECLGFMSGVAQALVHAHGQGVIHRDLKPANIMASKQGHPKVMDFGIARQAKESMTRVSRIADTSGTIAYMAPEQELKGEATPRTDLYSFAICLYEMLAGELPFIGPNFYLQKERAALKPLRQALPELPEPLAQAIERCLSFDPQSRFAGIAEFARASGMG